MTEKPAIAKPGEQAGASVPGAAVGVAAAGPSVLGAARGVPGEPATAVPVPPGAAPARGQGGQERLADLSPAPGAAPWHRMVVAQAMFDVRALLRNGEQLLLTLIIPVLLLTGFSESSVLNLGRGRRIDFLAPGIIALAVMSTSFTSQAITTGFERRYGVLRRLGTTPLSRQGLIAARILTMLSVEAGQLAVIAAVALALGWHPHGGLTAAGTSAVLVLAGTAAFSGLALLMAGTLRAEATLAAANLVYLVLLGLGGVMFPLAKFPAGLRGVAQLLPISALSTGVRGAVQHVGGFPARDLAVLAVWAVAGIALTVRTFRWD